MKFLFNSSGHHIANFVNGQLYATTGRNIGHFIVDRGIFIDMNGRYLGEIIYDNRLMKNRNSAYRSMNFGGYGNYGNVGNYGNPGSYGSIGIVSGFVDIPVESLA